MKWFTIDFNGGKDEQLFSISKVDTWEADVAYAKYVLEEQVTNKSSLVSEKWWEELRFRKFGLQLAAKIR